MKTQTKLIRDLIKKIGSQNKLSKALRCSQSTVSLWASGRPVGIKYCIFIEAKYGISRKDLRPDLFM